MYLTTTSIQSDAKWCSCALGRASGRDPLIRRNTMWPTKPGPSQFHRALMHTRESANLEYVYLLCTARNRKCDHDPMSA